MDNVVDHATDNGNTSVTRATAPAQQGHQCQHKESNKANKKRVMMPAQLWRLSDASRCQLDKGNNADEVVEAAMECGYYYLRLLLYDN